MLPSQEIDMDSSTKVTEGEPTTSQHSSSDACNDGGKYKGKKIGLDSSPPEETTPSNHPSSDTSNDREERDMSKRKKIDMDSSIKVSEDEAIPSNHPSSDSDNDNDKSEGENVNTDSSTKVREDKATLVKRPTNDPCNERKKKKSKIRDDKDKSEGKKNKKTKTRDDHREKSEGKMKRRKARDDKGKSEGKKKKLRARDNKDKSEGKKSKPRKFEEESLSRPQAETRFYKKLISYHDKHRRYPFNSQIDMEDFVKNWIELDISVAKFMEGIQRLRKRYEERKENMSDRATIWDPQEREAYNLAKQIWGSNSGN